MSINLCTPARATAALALMVALLTVPTALGAASGSTERLSVTDDELSAESGSGSASISANGRYVTFESSAVNLAGGDTNNSSDLFVRDRKLGTTTKLTRAHDGGQTNGSSSDNDISADGRYVTFVSAASNLVPGDTNGIDDVFVHDRQTGTTALVSKASDGTPGNNQSQYPDISADGRYVAFSSYASNLVVGDTNRTNDEGFIVGFGVDVFVHDRQLGTTTRVSVSSAGTQAFGDSHQPAISDDGTKVAFISTANNLAPAGEADFSDYDVYVHDSQNGATTLVHKSSQGTPGDGGADQPDISGDGRYVVFTSSASNLVAGDTNSTNDVFIHDRGDDSTARVSTNADGTQANGYSANPVISTDGSTIAFSTDAALVAGDTNAAADVYHRDRLSGSTKRVSVSGTGSQANADSSQPALDVDGSNVVFTSHASNLVYGDFNDASDVFVRDLEGVQAPPLAGPQVLVGNAAVYEGDAGSRKAVFTVTLDKPAASSVTVAYATGNASAVKSSDYTATKGTLSFAPGVTALAVKVPVAGDSVNEGEERFFLNLSGASGANIVDAVGVGSVLNDDPATISGRRLFIGDVAVYEGDGGSRSTIFTVSLSQPHSSSVTADFATFNSSAVSPGDYVAKSGTLNFAPGVVSQTIKVAIAPDATVEPHESFTVTLSNANAPVIDGSGTGTIRSDD